MSTSTPTTETDARSDRGPVMLTVADGVATVLVDSPPVNAMGHHVLLGLGVVVDEIAEREDIRAVVLTGGGSKAFMAGADIAEFEQIRSRPHGMADHSAWAGSVLARWADLPQPLIAAVQASAVGGGLEIALTADFILVEAEARLGLPEVKLGLIPGGGGTQRLPLRVGRSEALRLMMLGSVITAQEGLDLGLVDRVVESGTVVVAATELAVQLASRPRVAVQALKKAVHPDLGDQITRERQIFLDVASSDDFTEGLTAFMNKRKPAFTHH